MKRWIVVLAVAVLACGPALGQTKKGGKQPDARSSPMFSVRVLVDISYKGTSVNIFKQCLYRELRKIPEVTVVENNDAYNDYELSVVMVDSIAGGRQNGYAAAIEVISVVDPTTLDSFIEDDTRKKVARALLQHAGFPAGLWVETSPTLDAMCKDIAATFDTGPIEEDRQARQKYQHP